MYDGLRHKELKEALKKTGLAFAVQNHQGEILINSLEAYERMIRELIEIETAIVQETCEHGSTFRWFGETVCNKCKKSV